jgi:hypothetical protein
MIRTKGGDGKLCINPDPESEPKAAPRQSRIPVVFQQMFARKASALRDGEKSHGGCQFMR